MKPRRLDIAIHLDQEINLYTVVFRDGQGEENRLECLSQSDVRALTLGELLDLSDQIL